MHNILQFSLLGKSYWYSAVGVDFTSNNQCNSLYIGLAVHVYRMEKQIIEGSRRLQIIF